MGRTSVYDAVVAGHICFDVIPTFPEIEGDAEGFSKLLIPGKLVKIGPMATSTGGPVSNTGLALKRLGVKVTLMGKVGNDFLGNGIITSLKKEKLEKGMIIVPGESTSYTIVIAPPRIDRLFLHSQGANNTFGFSDVNLDIVKKAKLFHFGYPPLMEKIYKDGAKELIKIFETVKGLGVTTSLDMSLPDPKSESGKMPWRKVLERLIPSVDIYLPSAEESLFMLYPEIFKQKKEEAGKREMLDVLEMEEIAELGRELLDMGAKIVAIKSGYKGIYLITSKKEKLKEIGFAKPGNLENWAEREIFESAFYVEKIASATGSGDSAIAGFLAAYIKGLPIEETVRTACAVGWQNVLVMDAVSGIKSWDETMAQNKLNLPKNDIRPKTQGWKFVESERHWVSLLDRRFRA